MHRARNWKLLFFVIGFLVIGSPALAQPGGNLKDLRAVRVVVIMQEGQGTGAATERVLTKKLLLESGTVQTEIELKLRQAGMRILAGSTGPALTISLVAAGTRAVVVHLCLLESATLDRISTLTPVITWDLVSATQDLTANHSCPKQQAGL